MRGLVSIDILLMGIKTLSIVTLFNGIAAILSSVALYSSKICFVLTLMSSTDKSQLSLIYSLQTYAGLF